MNVEALRSELESQIEGDVRFDRVSRALYSTDASVYQIQPLGVVIVKSRQDVIRTVRICRRHRCPLTMRGGGTSQAGQAIGPGIQVDTSKFFNRVLEVNAAERWARVEPGIVLDELNARLRPEGLRFAPDISTASRATLGGMMGNNSSGARSVIYGKTIDHVLEQEVVLSDASVVRMRPLTEVELDAICAGDSLESRCHREVRRLARECAAEIDRRYPKILRRVGGYNLDAFTRPGEPFNLTKLMVGSEGTLGIVLEATVKLVPLPKAKAVLAIQFASLLEALEATPSILEHRPSAVEVMDRFILDNTRQSAALDALRRTFIEGDPAALLCVELYGDRTDELPPRLDRLEADLAARGYGYRYYRALDLSAQATIWGLRESALGLSMSTKTDAKAISFVEDTAVAPERLRDYIERFLAIIKQHGTSAGIYAHASVGCLHVRPVVNLKTEQGVRTFAALANDVSDLVLEFGGALSGEHGDGLVRSPFMEKMFGPVLYDAFRQIKRTFDPDGLFNPGKIVDPPPLTTNLRYGPGYETPRPETFFDYDDYGGMGGAVDMCSGLGVCRKTLDGTMCPSYMATRGEEHSTRGRANVLRLAMAGRLGETGLGDEGVKGVMALCLECRACKAECPVGVDVARFKSEFLADYWKRHGTPLRARVLGHIQQMSRWGSRLAPVSNWIVGSAPVRWLNDQFLGLDRRRKPPAWASRTFAQQFSALADAGSGFSRIDGPHNPPEGGSHRETAHEPVYIFNDTFTNYYNPEIGLAGIQVLQDAGISAGLAPNGCCGRPLISQGLLDEAREYAARNTDRLYPIAEQGGILVFFEPSCLSAIREDAPALLRGDMQRKARRVSEASMLFEALLLREWRPADRLRPLRPSKTSKILLHGHCHQKAMGLLPPARQLLSQLPGVTVVDLDAGCCGMAGSFGYVRDHYEVSRAIGERRLLPAARGLEPGSVLLASGVSCRHQVADFTGARALHPAEFLASLLPPQGLEPA
jgi:FAD/FMN-containing dehydrogenase/Fe-S oxidoreductase